MEVRRCGRSIEGIGTVDECSAERDGGCVFDSEVEQGGRGEDAVVCWGIGYCVADDFADFKGAGLVEEEHGVGDCLCRGSEMGLW